MYGKTMKNMRKRIKITIVKNKKYYIKYASKPTCVRWNIYHKTLVAIHEKKICLTLNKPIYVAFTVLEISRWEMYNFRYNFIIKKFNTKLLFTDTDSLCYEIYVMKNHNIGTYESNKTSLSCYDDKRYILNDGINTLVYGHKFILN